MTYYTLGCDIISHFYSLSSKSRIFQHRPLSCLMYNPELVCANNKTIYQSQCTSAWICLHPLQNLFSVLPHGQLGVDNVHHNIQSLAINTYFYHCQRLFGIILNSTVFGNPTNLFNNKTYYRMSICIC